VNYLSDEQRRQTGWSGVRKCGIMLKRALGLRNRSMRVLGILATGALFAFASGAFADSAVTQGSRAAGLKACVAPTDDMRRNHMEYLKHQRDRTVHQGVRRSKFGLSACVDCHAAVESAKAVPINAEGQFCQKCHSFTAVSIDCFQCHRRIPSQALAPLTGSLPGAHEGLRMVMEFPAPESASGLRQSTPMAQED